MITIEDCIALSELTEVDIDVVAEREHVPKIVAGELANYLVHTPDGCKLISTVIGDDIAGASFRGDFVHSAKLKLVESVHRKAGACGSRSLNSNVEPRHATLSARAGKAVGSMMHRDETRRHGLTRRLFRPSA
jgi:hypothetical protein